MWIIKPSAESVFRLGVVIGFYYGRSCKPLRSRPRGRFSRGAKSYFGPQVINPQRKSGLRFKCLSRAEIN